MRCAELPCIVARDWVWGDHVFIEERTVDVHIKRLREALATVDCAALISHRARGGVPGGPVARS